MRPLRCVFAAIISLALVHPVAAQAAEMPPAYVAVIDAGSSGTRLTLFAPPTTGGLAPQEVMESEPDTKGLSSFEDRPQAAGPDAIRPLLDQLRTYLSGEGVPAASVPVSLLATAGMRTLRLDNPAASAAIFASTQAELEASEFPIEDNRILPATLEGSLAWLDANALAGTVTSRKNSVGIVEIGGASAQVAFRSRLPRGQGVTRLTVNGTDIPVVSVSYLGLGSNEARATMQADSKGGFICFPNNASGTDPEVYQTRTPIPVPSRAANFGYPGCARAYDATIATVGSVTTASAEIPPSKLRDQPGFASMRFVGLGGIPFTFADVKIPAESTRQRALASAVRSTCTGPQAWTKVVELAGANRSSFTDTLCADGTYTAQFLFGKKGVGVNGKKFEGRPQFGDRDPSWSAGYAITALFP